MENLLENIINEEVERVMSKNPCWNQAQERKARVIIEQIIKLSIEKKRQFLYELSPLDESGDKFWVRVRVFATNEEVFLNEN